MRYSFGGALWTVVVVEGGGSFVGIWGCGIPQSQIQKCSPMNESSPFCVVENPGGYAGELNEMVGIELSSCFILCCVAFEEMILAYM